LLLEAGLLMAMGRKNDTVSPEFVLQQVADMHPEPRAQLQWLMALQFKAGQYPECCATAEQLMERYPGHVIAAATIFAALARQERLDDANALAATMMRRNAPNPATPVMFYEAAAADSDADTASSGAVMRARYEDIRDGLARQLEIYPDNLDVACAYARVLATHRECDDAVAVLNQSLARRPDDFPAMFLLARAFAWNGQREVALDIYNQLVALAPRDVQLARARGRLLGAMLRYDEAEAAYNAGIGPIMPDKSLLLERDAKVAMWNKRPLTAIASYHEYLKLRPNDAEALFDLGALYESLENLSGAATYYQRSVTASHGDVSAAASLENARLEAASNLGMQYGYITKRGFGDQYRIQENNVTGLFLSPELAPGWRVVLRGGQSFYSFPDEPSSGAVHIAGGIYKTFHPTGSLLHAELGESFYSQTGFVSGNWIAGMRHRATDWLDLEVGMAREDVVENAATLQEHTFRDKIFANSGSDITRRLRLDLTGDADRYNNSNLAIHANSALGYELMEFPHSLRAIWRTEYWNFQKNDQIYFSPASYMQYGPALRWRQYLGDDQALAGHRFYYGAMIGAKSDTNSDTFVDGGVELLYDIDPNWCISGNMSATGGSVYHDFLATLKVTFRF
jgi:tetratricopeptide (TPR) repeat protein